ncbi:MAG TPA: hypothetical protein VN549_05605 [Negativicutes bacterium]|nr:hypothetical protein [Negativicutes bacterium]
MSTIDTELYRMIRRIRDRMHAAAIMNSMLIGAVIALCLGMIIVIASRFIPIYNVYVNIIWLVAAAVGLTFLYASFRTPGNARAALLADSFGLSERTVTALELLGDQSAFAVLEKQDALKHLRGFDYRRRLPLRPKGRYMVVCLILISALVLSGFMPNPMEDKAAELHELSEKVALQQKKADKLRDKVKEDPRLSEEQKKELDKLFKELKSELKSAGDEKEIKKALGRTEKKLEYIKGKYSPGDDLDKIAEVLSQNDMTKALADMIKENDGKAFKENIKNLAEELNKLSPEEKQRLAEELTKLAKALSENPELNKAFAGLAEKLASGELGNLSGELEQLDKSISQLMEDESIREAISELTEQLAEAGESQDNASQGQQGQEGQDGNSQQGQGGTPGNNGLQGQGSQQGNNSQGQGQGSGAGNGTDKGNENQEPIPQNGSGIGKKDGSTGKTGEYEKIFTPQTLGGEGETSNLNGTKGTGGTTEQVITDKGRTVRGSSVPYDQVVGQYRDKAMESISTSDIPPGMKDMVKDYFTSLEE